MKGGLSPLINRSIFLQLKGPKTQYFQEHMKISLKIESSQLAHQLNLCQMLKYIKVLIFWTQFQFNIIQLTSIYFSSVRLFFSHGFNSVNLFKPQRIWPIQKSNEIQAFIIASSEYTIQTKPSKLMLILTKLHPQTQIQVDIDKILPYNQIQVVYIDTCHSRVVEHNQRIFF